MVSWDEAVRRCNSSSDEPLYLPGFSDDQFQEAGEYIDKHEIASLWINLKYSPVFVWNNGTVYSWYFSIDYFLFFLLYNYISTSVIFIGESIQQQTGECVILREGNIQAVPCNNMKYVTCQGNGK